MEIRKITSIEQFMDFRDDWNNILKRNQNNNPFIEFDWIRQWLTHFHEFFELYFYAVEHKNEVIAFFPLIKKKTRFYDYIQFAGFGQANYMDIVVIEKWKDQAIRLIMNEVINQRRTVLMLHGLLDSTGTANAFIQYCKEHQIPYQASRVVAPYIDLPMEKFDEFIKKRMKRHGADRKEKRLKKLGNTAFQPLKEDQLDAMFQLHEKRWQRKLDTSGFTKGHTHEFYKSLTLIKSEVLETKLDGLFIENQLVAFFYGFVCRNRYVLYILAHDDDFGVFSPGRILLQETVRDQYLNQGQIYDLSIGYEPYKLDWNTGMDYANKVMIPGKGWSARIGYWQITLRNQLIQLLKKQRGLVYFKRNTLGRIKKFLREMNSSYVKEITKAIGAFIFHQRVFEIYRVDRDRFEKNLMMGSCQPLTVKELVDYPSFFEGKREELIKRLFQKQQSYCLFHEGQLTNYFWVNDTEIRIDSLNMAEPLPENSAYVYDWRTFDINVAAELFNKNKKLHSIYVAIPSHWKDKKFFHDQGIARDHQMMKKTIFGFSFVRKGIFQVEKE
jgi:CelD/BcsL family acetyltransferase involved in cellulose biosynthesis